jgi:hypothetical protein
MTVDTIHLIHHTHHDYGYTDTPATIFRAWNDYHEQALDLIAASGHLHEDARFRWTCECFDPTLRWWRQAAPDRQAAFRTAVAEGRIEVGALPWTSHALSTRDGLDQTWRRSEELWAGMRTSFAMAVDVNGLSWGTVPWLRERGVELVWLSANAYSGRFLEPPPALRRWQGPDGGEIMLMIAPTYPGEWYFGGQVFRQLPQCVYDDPWNRPPDGNEILRSDPAAIATAQAHWARVSAEWLRAWPAPVLALPITNQWRMDNDPPFPGLSAFVAGWNASGKGPRLVISTPGRFLRDLGARMPLSAFPAVRGDLCDWWADAPMAMPDLVQTARRAQQQARVLVAAAPMLGSDPAVMGERLDAACDAAALAEEHTMGAYESLPSPHSLRSLANLAFRYDLMAAAEDGILAATRALIEASPLGGRFQRDQIIGVANPNAEPSGGFITLPANALRPALPSLEDLATGERCAVELIAGPDMEIPPQDPPPDGAWLVDDEWGFRPVQARVLIPPVPGRGLRRFRLVPGSTPVIAQREDVRLDASGGILDLRRHGVSCLGQAGPDGAGFAEPLIEAPEGKRIRTRLLTRSPHLAAGLLAPQRPELVHWAIEDHAGFTRLVRRWVHPRVPRIDQQFDLPHGAAWCEIRTTAVLHETYQPLGLHLALPLAGYGDSLRYHSLGHPTRPGHDQHPGASGEFIACDPGLHWSPTAGRSAWLDLRDTPLIALDRLATRSGRVPFVPDTCRCYAVLHQSWWNTNFPPTRSAVWSWTIRLGVSAGSESTLPGLPLLAFPARAPAYNGTLVDGRL